jgi:hypothetical protein
MVRYLFLDMPSSVALGIVEMQMQFATGSITPLLSVPAGQANTQVVGKVSRGEGYALWQRFTMVNSFLGRDLVALTV